MSEATLSFSVTPSISIQDETAQLVEENRATVGMVQAALKKFLNDNIEEGELGVIVGKFTMGESLSIQEDAVLQLEAAVKQRAVEPRPDERPPANPTRYRGNVIVNKDSGGGMPAPGQFKQKKGES